ncbi:hypothetical protein [Tellurirhabdus bombi]|uniref:hypothetical protein n=1 Tax=Tellurirhabdus bombi TaxID=2907205 RepID=UPI001F4851FC|nr:hypothetical protein [Tellurirhabdus bombi]
MKKYLFFSFILATCSLYECKTPRTQTSKSVTVSIDTENFLSCCAPNLTLPDGKPVWCETSAVLYDNGTVYLANDKEMPTGLSPVFSKPWDRLADTTVQPKPLLAEPFLTSKKFEDFATNGDYIFLTTAFDRVKPGSADWDGFNTILYWKRGNEAQPQVLAPEEGAQNSVAYREQLSRLLAQNRPAFSAGMPYFKVEGLAVKDSMLLFGVREEGESYSKFDYRTRIVAVSFTKKKTASGERLALKDDWRIVTDFDPASVVELPKPLALSSLEYDPIRQVFWLVTSIEKDNLVDAYLWVATADELLNNRPFTLVRDKQGQPIHFGHKAEDITLVGRDHLLLIHDDDRLLTKVGSRTRQPNQAAYTVLKVH